MNLVKCNNWNWPAKHSAGLFSNWLDDVFNDEHSFRENYSRPSANISEDDKMVKIEMALPGVKKDDLQVNVEGDRLWIRNRVKQANENNGKGYLHREFYSGAFERSFLLADSLDAESVDARFKNGMLEVEISKKQSEIPVAKEIKIR